MMWPITKKKNVATHAKKNRIPITRNIVSSPSLAANQTPPILLEANDSLTVASPALSFAMLIGVLTVEIRIDYARSLKDRRQCVRSLKDSLRHNFNVSVAELDETVVWRRATLGVAAISASRSYLTGQLEQVEKACVRIAESHGAQVSDSWMEIFPEE